MGSRTVGVLNDDNDGQKVKGLADDVVSGQALVRLATDAAGNIALIWYDTRRDPANHRLDVFATVSTDGGATFSPNFRVSSVSFDADQGRFTDATGKDNYYLGDFLGLALSDNRAYAAWTDTSAGNQDIRLSEFSLSSIPAPDNDRFEPNEGPALATQLGRVSTRRFPKLAIAPGDEDWFAVEAIASGTLAVDVTAEQPGELPQLELWDEAGRVRLAAHQVLQFDAQGRLIGRGVTLPARSGQGFQIRVLPGGGGGRYALEIHSLTADLGARVYGTVAGTAAAGDEVYYLLQVPAMGALEVKLTPGTGQAGEIKLEVLDARNLAVLAQASVATGPDASGLIKSLPVEAGQRVLLHLSAAGSVPIPFALEFSNLDAYENLRDGVLRFPVGAGASQAAFADLNGDGTLDALVSDALADTVAVLLGNGDGTFQSPREFRVGASPGNLGIDLELPTYRRDLIVADINQDGIPDAIVANYSSSDVSVLLGRGDGTFQGQRRLQRDGHAVGAGLGGRERRRRGGPGGA